MTRPRSAAALLRTAVTLAAVALTATTLLGACARPGTGVGGGDPVGGGGFADDGTATSIIAGQNCGSYGPTPAPDPVLTPLPADAVLVRATRCIFEPKTVPGDGEWLIRSDQQADRGLAALAAALRLPSLTRNPSGSCDLMLYMPIIITVTDQLGRQFVPAVPTTACGAPRPDVVAAMDAVPWKTVHTTKVQQTRTQLEITSGCSGQWKPMVAIYGAINGSAPRVSPVDTSATTLKVCRYALDPSQSIGRPEGSPGEPLLGGRLVAASTLDAAAAHDLLAAVAAAKPVTGACAGKQPPFADIWSPAGGQHITIELAGCYRVLVDSENYLRQLDAATVQRLLGS